VQSSTPVLQRQMQAKHLPTVTQLLQAITLISLKQAMLKSVKIRPRTTAPIYDIGGNAPIHINSPTFRIPKNIFKKL
jgi:hypothetical protein